MLQQIKRLLFFLEFILLGGEVFLNLIPGNYLLWGAVVVLFLIIAIQQAQLFLIQNTHAKIEVKDILYPLLAVTQSKQKSMINLNTTSVISASERNFLGVYQFAVIEFENIADGQQGEIVIAKDVAASIQFFADGFFENKVFGEMFGRWWDKPEPETEADVFSELLRVRDIKPNKITARLVIATKKSNSNDLFGFSLDNHVGEYEKYALGARTCFAKVVLAGTNMKHEEYKFRISSQENELKVEYINDSRRRTPRAPDSGKGSAKKDLS